MGNRKTPLVTGEFYHIYLRGVEKRRIVLDELDIDRFLLGLGVFNTVEAIGSIYEHSIQQRARKFGSLTSKTGHRALVELFAYNILPNHYHLLLRQVSERGVSKYMQSLNGGYTKYFNHKYKRVGPLFQGTFSSTHIRDDARFIYTSAYVNLNHIVHRYEFGSLTSKWGRRSSWEQYCGRMSGKSHIQCNTEMILSKYSDRSEYLSEARGIAKQIAKERDQEEAEEEEVYHRYLEV